MAELITALLTYGPLGIISGVLLKMYLAEKETRQTREKELTEKIETILSKHAQDLKDLYDTQNQREKEVNRMLKDYGQGVVDAVEQTHDLANRIWSIRK